MADIPPRSLHVATQIYSGILSVGIAFMAFLVVYGHAPSALVGGGVLIGLLTVQLWATFGASKFAATLSGTIQFTLAMVAGFLFTVSALFVFIWPPATILVLGSMLFGYGSYWMAWQNWIWLQQLRGFKEDQLPLPRTLTIYQLMITTAIVAAVCGLANLLQLGIQEGR